MKKFLSFLLFALCLTVAANAQTIATYDFEDGTIPAAFTNDETYPWIVIDTTDDDGNAVRCIMSGNKGVASSTSAIETTVGFTADGYIAFDALCMGEGTGTAWDRCIFYIDGEAQFTYGAHIAGWNHYAYNVSAGSHTFKWVYMKDSSVNPTGDAFFVDNISFGLGTLITEINIIGFTEPAWGEHPDYEVSVPADANYTLNYVDWNWDDGDNMGILNESGTFNNEDYVYYMYFLVSPNEGCSFADDVTFMVNGETGSIENSGLSSSGSGSYWAYTINYSVIEPTTPEVQSTANWYGYATYAEDIQDYFITFSMQDINTVNAATSSTVDEDIYAACYANSYVWCITDGSKLLKASVDNTNHTIGNFETVASNFVSETAISMSYNPADGKIYAITADYLISFDPSDPVGTLSNEIPLNISPQTLAINSEGEAYCIEYVSGDLYQLNLSDGSATQIGNTGQNVAYVQDMAFDMNTGELFWAQLYSTNDYGMYKVDPATAATTYLGQVANGDVMEITGLFMVYDEQPEACMSPAPLNATPAATTATVSWTERGEATQWVVAYKADGETDFTEVTANETNYTLTGLTPGTHYTVKVRPVCEDGTLKWNSVYFTTHGLCDDPSGLVASNVTGNTATLEWTGYQENYNVRYMPGEIDTLFFEDFENGLPDTWTTIDNDGDGYNWFDFDCTGYVGQAHSGTGIVNSESYINGYGPLTPDNWLITPQIDLDGIMRVWLRGMETSYASEHFAIYLSTTNNSVDDFTITLVPEAVATGEYVEYTADLSAYAGQRGYIAIRHFNTYDMYRLNVDDFGVFLEPWTTVTSTGNPTTLTGLDPETTYQVQVQGICESGMTEWTEPVMFTTEPAPACVIDTIEIYGFTEPVYGATPDYDVEVPADADYTLDNVLWAEYYSEMTAETFVANLYYMVFDIAPNEGCIFADNLTVTINNDASLVDTYWCNFLSNGDYRVFTKDYVLSAPPCDAPSDLSVTDITSNSATVNWDPSYAENYDLRYYKSLDELENESWQYYDNGNNENAIGTDGGNFWWGVMFPGGTYSSSTTATVLHVQAYDYMSMNGTVTLYNGGDYAPANPVGTTNVTFTESEEFVEFTFDEPVAIDPSNNLWVVFYNESGAPHPAAVCANTGNPNGRWISLDGSVWEDLTSYELDYTFMIRAGILDVDANELSWTEIDGIEDNTSALTGLAANTDYKVQVRANCEDGESAWSDPVEFTTEAETEEPCETPTGLTASNITATTAKLEWTGSQDQYTVRYKEDAASDWTEATTTNRFFPLTGLTPATTYTAQVQGDCGSGAKSVTDWSEPVTFTTLSGTVEPGECGPAVDCEGTSYPTVKIGDVCWMAKNLAAETCVTTGNVYAYVNDQFPDEDANVETYGLLYDEEAAFATGICPEGYTLPTTEQFEYLKNNFTVEELRNSTGWVVNTGTNGTGFSWDGSGFRNGTSDNFEHMLMEGYLWAVDMTSGTPQPAMYKMMYYCNEIVRVYDFDGISASIRCVKNAEPQPEPQPEPEPEPEPETFTCGTSTMIDADYNEYETVEIGTQCWTKTNLRVKVGEEIVSGNAEYPATEAYRFKVPSRDLAIYGYLYNWKAANMVCPTGWHLPTDAEWTQMENVVSTIPIDPDATGNRGDHLGKLAAYDENWDPSSTPNTPGYTEPFDDRNLSGFSARPMGYYWRGFDAQTRYAQFWTATENPEDTTKAYDRWMGYLYTSVQRYSHSKTMGYSVRCVRDSE